MFIFFIATIFSWQKLFLPDEVIKIFTLFKNSLFFHYIVSFFFIATIFFIVLRYVIMFQDAIK